MAINVLVNALIMYMAAYLGALSLNPRRRTFTIAIYPRRRRSTDGAAPISISPSL